MEFDVPHHHLNVYLFHKNTGTFYKLPFPSLIFLPALFWCHFSAVETPPQSAAAAVALDPSVSGAAIRQKFLDFFAARGHTILPSSSLVPEDPSVLLTIAGMLQFKPIFLGQVPPPNLPTSQPPNLPTSIRVHYAPGPPTTSLHTSGWYRMSGEVVSGAGVSLRAPRHHVAEVHPHERHRERGGDRPPPHLLRDARELQFRGLLQEGGLPLGLGACHQRVRGQAAGVGNTRKLQSTSC